LFTSNFFAGPCVAVKKTSVNETDSNRRIWEITDGILSSGAEAEKRAGSFRFFSTGSPSFDRLLGGGVREGKVVEFFGRSNSGKSQVAMQTALYSAYEGAKVLFVDTEGSFRPERMEAMAESRGWNAAAILDRVVYVRTDSSSEQMETVRRMGKRETTAGCRLVVIDTLTRNFTTELPGRSNMASRQGALNIHLSEMCRDAYIGGRAYVLTNRVTFGQPHDVSIGGRTVEQLVDSTVRLEREGGRIKATLIPGGGVASADFGEKGIG
jgi:DNA repair protein RadA